MRGALPPSFPPSHCVVFTAAAAAEEEEEEEEEEKEEEEGRPPVWSCVSHTHSRTEEGGDTKKGEAPSFLFPWLMATKRPFQRARLFMVISLIPLSACSGVWGSHAGQTS